MKKLFLIVLLSLSACTKTWFEEPPVLPTSIHYDRVFDKFYANPPGDTMLSTRTYWLWLAHDSFPVQFSYAHTWKIDTKQEWDTIVPNVSIYGHPQ